ncbi:hypothetical protein FQN54_000493 [Arachnomyces sp. PD_36]|nr:hypothetical protein FQN54_000493 [Arachnomyces sp. PD_36]
MASKKSLRPQYFLARPDGKLTALVAVDELPRGIVLRDIPRTLESNDTMGLVSLGTAPRREEVHGVKVVSEDQNVEIRSSLLSLEDNAKKISQQGCIYKHEMPQNPEVMKMLGLRSIPRWYRNKQNSTRAKIDDSSDEVFLEDGETRPSTRESTPETTVNAVHPRLLNRWRKFAEDEPESAPATTSRNVSGGSSSTAVASVHEVQDQDLLGEYPVLDPTRSIAEAPSNGGSAQDAGSSSTAAATSQASANSPSRRNVTPQKDAAVRSSQRVTPPRAAESTPTRPSRAGLPRPGNSSSSPQPQKRRGQRISRSGQSRPTLNLLTRFSPAGKASTTKQSGTTSSEAEGGQLPRLTAPDNRASGGIQASSTPATSSVNATNSSPTPPKNNKPTTTIHDDGKGDNSLSKGTKGATNDQQASAVVSAVSRDGNDAAKTKLKPGEETDVFGLGLFEN